MPALRFPKRPHLSSNPAEHRLPASLPHPGALHITLAVILMAGVIATLSGIWLGRGQRACQADLSSCFNQAAAASRPGDYAKINTLLFHADGNLLAVVPPGKSSL